VSPEVLTNRRVVCAALIGLLWLAACSPAIVAPERASEFNPAGQLIAADGVRLPVRTYPARAAPHAVLLALHGFNDHGGFIDEAARYFAAHGIVTVAYDQRGFGGASDRGRWGGATAMADDFFAMLRELRARYPGLPIYVLGESMGAAVLAVALAGESSSEVAGVILATPAVWSRDTMPWYQRFGIWAGAGLTPGMTLHGPSFGIHPSDNVAVREAMAKDSRVTQQTRLDSLSGLTDLMDRAALAVPQIRQRTLLLYGLRDEMMPRRPLIGLFERWPETGGANFRFGIYPDGYHLLLRDLQRQVVWDDVLAWIRQAQGPLPSGFERQLSEVLPLLRMGD